MAVVNGKEGRVNEVEDAMVGSRVPVLLLDRHVLELGDLGAESLEVGGRNELVGFVDPVEARRLQRRSVAPPKPH